jgi:hypothetical protein
MTRMSTPSASSLEAASCLLCRARHKRHEGGARLLEAGWPVHYVQHMLGHASLQQTSTYLNATLRGLHESMRNLDQSRPACKRTRPRPPACSQAGSRQKREVLASLIVMVGGVDGTRTRGLRRDRRKS